MPVRVELFDDLDAVARDAGGALDRRAQPSLFDRLDWFRLTLAHCPPPGRLLVARARSDRGSAAWLFLTVDRGRARMLASWYSLAPGIPCERPDPALTPLCLAAIARRLADHGAIHRIDLAPLARGSREMADALAGNGWITRRDIATWNWSVAVEPGDWDAYWDARPATLRNILRRKARAAGLDIAVAEHFDPVAWDDYEAAYRASWKPAEGSPAFLRELAMMESAAGTLRLGIARREGQAVAAQFWLVEDGIATIHKLAHVAAADRLSPGTILSAAMFRHVIERDRVRRIDFGAGDDRYKADWMDERRPLHALTAWNRRTARGLVGVAAARTAMLVRRRASG